eukprot:65354-Pleurochrysis_carterae.AAC.1
MRATLDALTLDGVLEVEDEAAGMLADTGVAAGPALRGSFLGRALERHALAGEEGDGGPGEAGAGRGEGGADGG